MKRTGIVRHLDDLGRIVIPKELRKELNFKENEALYITKNGNKIEIEKQNEIICNCGQVCNNTDNYCSNCGKNFKEEN